MGLLNNQNSKARGRKVGLSSQQRPAPSIFPTKPPVKQLKVPKAIDDPPVSSDEEDSQPDIQTSISRAEAAPSKNCVIKTPSEIPFKKRSEATGLSRVDVHNLSSGDELASRVDIQSTKFTRVSQGEASKWKTQRKRNGSLAEPSKGTCSLQSKKQRRGEDVCAKRLEKDGPAVPTSSSEHCTDPLAFAKTRKSRMTYRTRVNSSQEHVTKEDKDKKNRRKMKIPEGFSEGDADPISEIPKAKKLLIPPGLAGSSPRPKALLKVPGLEYVKDRTSGRPSESFKSSKEASNSKTRRKLHQPPQLERTPTPPRAGLSISPPSIELQLQTVTKKEAGRSSSIDFSETDDSGTEEGDSQCPDDGQVATDAVKPAAVCPWCGEQVDSSLLEEFAKGKRLNVRLQTKFCQAHKKKTAGEVWQQREYPQVEWDNLDRRFAVHSDWLLGIIHGKPSHFRTMHGKNIESGKARSMKKEGNMNPGYYGPRGFNVMCDYLVQEFGDLLKKKAVDDRVIAGRGSASFIQNVLVAELAVQLIREDMQVSEDEAIFILEDSKALGELIHEEV